MEKTLGEHNLENIYIENINFTTVSKTLARDTNLKIILLDH